MTISIRISAVLFSLFAFACAGPEFTGGAEQEVVDAGGSAGSSSDGGTGSLVGTGGSTGGTSSSGGSGSKPAAGEGGEGGAVEPTLCSVPDVTALPEALADYTFELEVDGHCARAAEPVHCSVSWSTPELLDENTVRVQVGSVDCGTVTIEHGVCGNAEPLICEVTVNNRAWKPAYQFDLKAAEGGFVVEQFSEFNTPLPVNDMIVSGDEAGMCSSGTPSTGPNGFLTTLTTALSRKFVSTMENHVFPCAQ